MGTTFRPYSPGQELLLPPSLNEWLPEGHLAYFVSDVVEELDLSAFYARYEGNGRRNSPFDPRMMLKILIYAYATGVFSSRKIARKLWPSGFWRQATSPGIARSVISANTIWLPSRPCLFRWSGLPGKRS